MQRVTVWNNYFYNLTNGQVGNDNVSGVYYSNNGASIYWLVKHNTFDTFTNDGANGSYMDLYYTSYVVIEENIAKNSRASYGIWAKATLAYVTIRANDLSENNTKGGIDVHYGDAIPGTHHDHEVCWNNVVLPMTTSGGRLLNIMGDAVSSINKNPYNSFVYRNTFAGGFAHIKYQAGSTLLTPAENFKVDANVVVSDNPSAFTPGWDGRATWDTTLMDTVIPNLIGKSSNHIVNSTTGELTGSYREKHLGAVGHEVSDRYITKPKTPILLID